MVRGLQEGFTPPHPGSCFEIFHRVQYTPQPHRFSSEVCLLTPPIRVWCTRCYKHIYIRNAKKKTSPRLRFMCWFWFHGNSYYHSSSALQVENIQYLVLDQWHTDVRCCYTQEPRLTLYSTPRVGLGKEAYRKENKIQKRIRLRVVPLARVNKQRVVYS